MFLEFLTLSETGKRTENAIYIPCAYFWQEGPHDTHVQFDSIGSDNFCPLLNEQEQYVIPCPKNPTQTILAYHFGLVPTPRSYSHRLTYISLPAYLAALKRLWSHSNG